MTSIATAASGRSVSAKALHYAYRGNTRPEAKNDHFRPRHDEGKYPVHALTIYGKPLLTNKLRSKFHDDSFWGPRGRKV